jgi:hypothetical protein
MTGSTPAPKQPKIQEPERFDGNRKKWTKFLTSFNLWAENYYEFFSNQRNRCSHLLRLCLEGKSSAWAENIIRTRGTGTESIYLRDYDALIRHAAGMWGPVNVEEEARRDLDKIRQAGSVGDYIALFQKSAGRTGYGAVEINRKFYNGLNSEIKDMMVGPGKPVTLEGTIELAATLETRIMERRDEKKDSGSSDKKKEYKKEGSKETIKAGRLSNEEMAKLRKEGRCFRCKGKNHLAKDCPQKPQKVKAAIAEEEEGEKDEEDTKEDFVEG